MPFSVNKHKSIYVVILLVLMPMMLLMSCRADYEIATITNDCERDVYINNTLLTTNQTASFPIPFDVEDKNSNILVSVTRSGTYFLKELLKNEEQGRID